MISNFDNFNAVDFIQSQLDPPFVLVTIPSYAEEDVATTLHSLDSCQDCGHSVGVILLINSQKDAPPSVLKLNTKAYDYAFSTSFKNIKLFPLMVSDIPQKVAGVGMARRLAMGTAADLYKKFGQSDLPLLALDADSTVEKNYLCSTLRFFQDNPELDAASIYFEHPLSECRDSGMQAAIIDYELHLRYFVNAQKWAGHPAAFQTVGSSMAVRGNAYTQQGGMNKRKAGEDFYFLHKFSKIGKLGELNDTTVYPGIRTSERVPFGTGRALLDIENGLNWSTYSPQTFQELSKVIRLIRSSFGQPFSWFDDQLPDSFKSFTSKWNMEEIYNEIAQNTGRLSTYQKRFFQWFDAFQLFKFAHHCRDHFYPNVGVSQAVKTLLKMNQIEHEWTTANDLLIKMRESDRKGLCYFGKPENH